MEESHRIAIEKACVLHNQIYGNIVLDSEFVEYCEKFYKDSTSEVDSYLVLTEEEAENLAQQYIEESLWAFNISFLYEFLDEHLKAFADEILEPLQEKCEDSNEAIKALVQWDKQKNDIIYTATRYDGRGHFISHYNGEEIESNFNGTMYYLYGMN